MKPKPFTTSVTLTAEQRTALALFLYDKERNDNVLNVPIAGINWDDLVSAFNEVDGGDRDPQDYEDEEDSDEET